MTGLSPTSPLTLPPSTVPPSLPPTTVGSFPLPEQSTPLPWALRSLFLRPRMLVPHEGLEVFAPVFLSECSFLRLTEIAAYLCQHSQPLFSCTFFLNT